MSDKILGRIAVVMYATGDYAFSVACTAQSLINENPDTSFDFFVLHDGISEGDKSALISILSNVNFIYFDGNELTNFIARSLGEEFDAQKTQSLVRSRKIYFISKVFMFSLLERYSQVLYLDTDILIVKSISDIFDHHGVSWVNARAKLSVKLHKASAEEHFSYLPENALAPNAGLIYLNGDIPYAEITRELCLILQNYHRLIGYAIDEAAIACGVHKSGVPVHSLKKSFNRLAWESDSDTCVVHAMGRDKFWNQKIAQVAFPSWRKYYERWLDASGSQFKGNVEGLLPHFRGAGSVVSEYQLNRLWLEINTTLRETFGRKMHLDAPPVAGKARYYCEAAVGDVYFEFTINYEFMRIGIRMLAPQHRSGDVGASADMSGISAFSLREGIAEITSEKFRIGDLISTIHRLVKFYLSNCASPEGDEVLGSLLDATSA